MSTKLLNWLAWFSLAMVVFFVSASIASNIVGHPIKDDWQPMAMGWSALAALFSIATSLGRLAEHRRSE